MTIWCPQVGWNQIRKRNFHPILSGIEDDAFCLLCALVLLRRRRTRLIAARRIMGPYPSVIGHGDLCGVQFHPEKSQAVGLRMLSNFAHRIRGGSWNDVPQAVQPAET